ncbi:transcription factor S [Candidatus Woesearchaeota archaeon]|nr:transcription factor S [Candidatus Woesearchaeota archaeon]
MLMKFCPKCKSLMLPKKHGSKVIMTCTSCGVTDDKAETVVLKEQSTQERKIKVIDTESEMNLPLTNEICAKCGHKKAYYWLVQTRAADESATKFLKCEKCGHTWRDAS